MTSKKLIPLVILTVAVFVGLVSYGDFKEIGRQLAHFPVTHILAALGLAALNYGLRFLRWAYYLRVLGISPPFGLSILVFLSGLAMSITPGKAGELLKCYLLRDRTGVPVSASVPVVIMERLTDVVSITILALLGLALLPKLVLSVIAVVLAMCAAAMLLVLAGKGDRLVSLPFLRRWKDSLRTSYEGLRHLAAPSVSGLALVLGVAAWLCEGLALWVILDGLDAHLSVLQALSIYAAATLVGAVTALPGGLVGTEGSMVALLQQSGIARGAASAGTLMVRLVTLWFAVIIGLVALACLNRLRPAADAREEPESPVLRVPS